MSTNRLSSITSTVTAKQSSNLSLSRLAVMTSLAFATTMPTMANASGLFLQEAVTANAGVAGAGDGVYTDSAAAMWTNPATMSFMGESLTTINVMAFDLKMKFHDADTPAQDGEAQSYLPSISIFHAHQVSEKVHLGLALGAAGGSSLSYGDDWAGAGALDSITLNVIVLNPSLSYKINEQWSVAGGVQFSWAAFEQSTALISTKQDTDWAYGYNLGVMYRPTDSLDLGLSYRSKSEHSFDAELHKLPLSVSTDIEVPEIVDLSTRYGFNKELNLLASIQFHRWSAWDQTVLDLGGPINGVSIKRDWDDVWKFAIGADYKLNSDWRLKAGFSYETSPQDDPEKQWVDLPVGEQYRYSVGASTNWDNVGIDFFYEYADLGEVESAKRFANNNLVGVNGTFDGRIHFVGVNFTI
ncbi:long-chain fatty acid transporter [Vibrio inusitatus NBRC 102082]|uniref:Long-chain fatty acid transporter n=1 Tax=Vibrio inusitatus NBRC 102082 TaxID=1219070 RepID=A0A4Y3HU02_9VIBR|nr:outer membrane protein transport protein [Vibrio inusitatus]GEA50240.1 long-chain fatty acid transporter [Vibrio inusitatus NBRC 102082]